jgi:23S rRNA-intervening sequence protein
MANSQHFSRSALHLIGKCRSSDNLVVRDFRELKVWEKSHKLTLRTNEATSSFPRQEMYGLASQLRRCTASIPANITEGCGRSDDAELGWSVLKC